MITEPSIVVKPAQPYAAIPLTLTQPEIASLAPPLIADVIAWLQKRGSKATGAPFFDYVSFVSGGTMDMLVGMPTTEVLAPDGDVVTGTIPGGRFAALTYTGPYSGLLEANMTLDDWIRKQGLRLDGSISGGKVSGATRLENYLDPGRGPSGHSVTEVAFRLLD